MNQDILKKAGTELCRSTAVAIFFFNRPEFLRRLIGLLSRVKPRKIYLVCDGPRHNKPGEIEKVEGCRSLFENLDWECEIQRNYSDVNLGCRNRIISGLDWVFEQEERAIILEDDCIPIVDFFPFAEEMLERFKDDKRIFSVGGTNQRPQLSNLSYDVVFSKYSACWGWATWRRAWLLMDRHLLRLPEAKKSHLFKKWLGSWRSELYWSYILKDDPSVWGYSWMFTAFSHHGLHVLPSQCLIENIGMTDKDATHTTFNPYDLPVTAKSFSDSYRVPHHVEPDLSYDQWMEDHFYSRALVPRIKWVCKKVLNPLHSIANLSERSS